MRGFEYYSFQIILYDKSGPTPIDSIELQQLDLKVIVGIINMNR
jgi:hypothetical protein